MGAQITAFGSYKPENVVTNHFFEGKIDTNDEWIRSRTGIKERRFADKDEYVSDLCAKAALDLSKRFDKSLDDVDFIIVASISAEHIMPSVACQVQAKLEIPNAGGLDITAACAGFVYAIQMAQGLVEAGSYKKILVLGAEKLTNVVDMTDRATCILFGDAAGCCIVEPTTENKILSNVSKSQGEDGYVLYLSEKATSLNGQPIEANNKLFQNGRKVFKWAITTISKQIEELCTKADLTLDDIDWLVPHSANLRIIEGIAKSLNFPLEKTLESVCLSGNTSSASIPLAFVNGLDAGKIKKGDKVLFIGFGGGLTYAGTIFEMV